MKKIMFILIVAALVLMACSSGQYQVKESFPGDEAWITKVCYPNNRDCKSSWPAIEVPGTGNKMPPAGAWCKDLGGYVLDCGKKYSHIRLLVPPN